MHYNNPVRSRAEIATAVELGVRVVRSTAPASWPSWPSWCRPRAPRWRCASSCRCKGAAYDFGAKFGATAETAAELLARGGARLGFVPSLTFHPGTQCTDPAAWEAYIRTAAEIARDAGVRLARLNVGGGFPSHRLSGRRRALEAIFALIEPRDRRGLRRRRARRWSASRAAAWWPRPSAWPPGSGRSATTRTCSSTTAIYGGLAELPLIGVDRPDRGARRTGRAAPARPRPRIVFGPDLRQRRPAAGRAAAAGRHATRATTWSSTAWAPTRRRRPRGSTASATSAWPRLTVAAAALTRLAGRSGAVIHRGRRRRPLRV